MPTKKPQSNNKSLLDTIKGSLSSAWSYLKTHTRARTTLLVVVLVLLFDIVTPYGGQLRFYAKWVECGSRPYSTGGFLGGFGSAVRHYEPAPTFTVDRGGNTNPYFCTPKEAELAGYSASEHSYAYPHLTQDEIETMQSSDR